MSSTEKQSDVATQEADDVISAKEKGSGDGKTEKSPQKRPASEVNDDGDLKQKVQKTDHKGDKKENGEAEDKYDDDDGGDEDEEDDAAADDYDEEGDDGDDPEDGAEDDDEDDDA